MHRWGCCNPKKVRPDRSAVERTNTPGPLGGSCLGPSRPLALGHTPAKARRQRPKLQRPRSAHRGVSCSAASRVLRAEGLGAKDSRRVFGPRRATRTRHLVGTAPGGRASTPIRTCLDRGMRCSARGEPVGSAPRRISPCPVAATRQTGAERQTGTKRPKRRPTGYDIGWLLVGWLFVWWLFVG